MAEKNSTLPTAETLRDLFAYDALTGAITYRKDYGRWGVHKAGAVAGCITRDGYVQIMYQRRALLGHRIAWAITHGAWPTGHIDHVNGVPGDNRIANLRDVSCAANIQNQRQANTRNALGLLGVSQQSKYKYRAKIKAYGVKYDLGAFDTPEEAHAAYIKAKRQLHEGCTL